MYSHNLIVKDIKKKHRGFIKEEKEKETDTQPEKKAKKIAKIEEKPIKEKEIYKIKPSFESTRILPHKIKGNNIHMTILKLNPDDKNSLENIETFVNNMRKNFKGVSSYQIMVTFSSGKQYSCNKWSPIDKEFEMQDFNSLYVSVGEITKIHFLLNM